VDSHCFAGLGNRCPVQTSINDYFGEDTLEEKLKQYIEQVNSSRSIDDIDELFETMFNEELPTNNTSGVVGAGDDGVAVVRPSAANKYKKKNKKSADKLIKFKDSIKV
jgi:hypothetical protein